MKYKFWTTIETCMWLFFAVFLSFKMLPLMKKSVTIDLPPWAVGLMIVGTIAIGAVIAILVLRKFKFLPQWLKDALVPSGWIFYSFVVSQGVIAGFKALGKTYSFWWQVLLQIGIMIAVFGLADSIRHRRYVGLVVRMNNMFMMTLIAYAAASFAVRLDMFVVLLLLAVIAVYDMIAVWKMGTMQEMAFGMADLGIIPGIGIVVNEKDVRLLGGGDVLFIAMVGGVMMTQGFSLATAGIIGMLVGIVGLLFFAKKEKMYPAIPFILIGCVVGMGIGWLI